MKRVLVTGANGFVGRCVCRQLLAQGLQVRGTIRRAAAAADLPEQVESVVIGDIASFDGWQQALEDVDAVVHLVARTHVMKEQVDDPLPLYRQVNVTGTQRLLTGCRASGVSRFVFVSSIKAVGESTSQDYTEEMDCKPENAYGVSKREAEQLVLDSQGLEPVVLRPPLIYGPGVIGNFKKILKAVDRGLPLPLSRINNRRSLLYVDNLAAAILVCLQHPNAAHQTFHLADESPVSTTELVREMSTALGKRARLLPVPVRVLRAVGQLTQRQDQVERLVSSLTLSTKKIERLTGWQPQVSLSQGLAATVEHYRAA